MKARLALVIALALIAMAAPGFAQQPGEIFGKVADASGAVMPGVTVTLSGPRLLQPMTAVSSATGTYRFPGLAVGTYAVKFELAGFKTFVRDGIRVEIAANVQINAALEISTVQETVTVSGATPVVDLRDTSKTSRFTQETLQSIPSARDPWVIIEQAAGVAMDRQNVGGSASGQQSNFVARGAAMSQQKWNLDGVDITDMNATGGSPVYFDFDSFEEMQISAGGADVTMQSPGVGVNLVTKSGTDRLKGSGRFYVTDEKFQAVNVTDELRKQGAATGNPIQNIKDYGIEMGGPIKKGRAWFWGSIGKQNVNVGINNFYKSTPECLAMKATPLNYSIEQLRGCLNTDQTLLNNYNAKIAVETFKNNQFSFLFNGAEKVRNARDASDLRPEETTYRQMGVTRADLGSSLVEDRDAQDLQVERPPHHQRPLDGGGLVRPRRQQLRADVPRREPARRAAALRDDDAGLGAQLPGIGIRPSDRQHRPDEQLLPPGRRRRRPRLQVRLQVPQRRRVDAEHVRRRRLRPRHQRRTGRGADLPARQLQLRAAQPEPLRPGHLQPEEADDHRRPPLRLPDGCRVGDRRSTHRRSTASPPTPGVYKRRRRTPARRSTSCRLSASAASRPASPTRPSRRASASPTT